MTSMTNKIVIRLGALMVVLTGLLGTVLALVPVVSARMSFYRIVSASDRGE
jgi:hypothetical protein